MGNMNVEAYLYYKQEHPGTVIFFRVGDDYEAHQEDAIIAGPIIGVQVDNIPSDGNSAVARISFPIEKVYDYASLLAFQNIPTKIISRRDKNGKFDIPDVKETKRDQEIDY